jgi:formamidopyrimidine-DNA glycosylase
MPELPEVETTLRGIYPHIIGQKVSKIIVRHPTLRWPIPVDLDQQINGRILNRLTRRGKYLLFEFKTGTLILHLGMSGRLRVLTEPVPPQKHDHVDLCFKNKTYLRFTDPRRFGALLWTSDHPLSHPLLSSIGPEPFTDAFGGDYLFQQSRKKKASVKSLIMDSKIVAGVGNIYATEALFEARIRPQTAAGKLTVIQYQALAQAIKKILKKAIEKGGTTLKDFLKSDGGPGYFSIELKVYGRGGKPCARCKTPLIAMRTGQRSTVYCKKCQY